jgi:amino acid transporter
LLYLVAQIVAAAMVAKSFGAYADRLLVGDMSSPIVRNLFASAIVILLVLINMIGTGTVGRTEELLVVAKLIILTALMLAGVASFNPAMLSSGPSVGPMALFASIGLTFFAYAGYGMMTNAAGHVANPQATIPRAIFLAIIVVIALYIGLAVIVLGNISDAVLARYSSTAVAEAARPVLGSAGFVVVSISALFATASGIMASIFCTVEISKGLVANGQLPGAFGKVAWRQGTSGLFWATAVILVLVNLVDLSAVAQIASATLVICHLAVSVAHWRLHDQAGGSRLLIFMGVVMMAAVLVAFTVHLWTAHPLAIGLTVIAVLGSLGVEWLIQRRRRTD